MMLSTSSIFFADGTLSLRWYAREKNARGGEHHRALRCGPFDCPGRHPVVCGNSRNRVLQGWAVSETGDSSEFDAAVERGADFCRGQPGDCLRADVQARPVET